MAGYYGRRGPNVSQYLAELNAIPSHDTTADDSFDIDDDLAVFTNTQFFDSDSGQNTDYQAPPVKPDAAETAQHQASRPEDPASANSAMTDFPSLDFMSGDFNFSDFSNTYASPTLASYPDNVGTLQPIQPNHHPAVYPGSGPQQQHHQQHQQHQHSNYVAPVPRIGEKRKAGPDAIPGQPVGGGGGSSSSSISQPHSVEDPNRVAADEDKRRRNTAASARFRQKKKQREQAMEKSAKEMTEKVTVLEGRIQQLETENKWLKNLVMEKNDGKDDVASIIKELSSKQAAAETKEAADREAEGELSPAAARDEAEFGDETG